MRVYFRTFGCKANQYDTDRMRQVLAGRGSDAVDDPGDADVCVVNTCTVTHRADASARAEVRKLRRENPGARIVVAGCSAAVRADDYAAMEAVDGVVAGHDAGAVADAVGGRWPSDPGVAPASAPSAPAGPSPVAPPAPLRRRRGGTRAWLKIQDGCDRKCSFCITRIARGGSRSRSPDAVVAEARTLARAHPELVLTGIHIGHYGRDLDGGLTLAGLVRRLLDAVSDVRIRLSSIEATEVDDALLELLEEAGTRGGPGSPAGGLAPHLHMPLQSGADPVLRRMRRWHTRDDYRRRALEIADRVPRLGMGADIIAGFPGETEADHRETVALVDELPFTYLHVFPYSPREGTAAAELPEPVPERVAGERSRELRELGRAKGREYRESRVGEEARVILEGDGADGLTGDYLRVSVRGGVGGLPPGVGGGSAVDAVLRGSGDALYIEAA